jgi:hypothetical protein
LSQASLTVVAKTGCPHTPPDIARWLALGYTSEKMLDAGRTIIDATMAAFPNQYVTLAVGGTGEGTESILIPPRTTWRVTPC